ncbi:MAG: KOW domain-containing RNA-binding protein [Clostridia bacterium]|nr:KOW domain-containing RNA-binding protein [Clostridia bacterium]
MQKIQPVVGGVCKSTQGRDAGKYYLIKEVLPKGYVLVADGDGKKLAAPKKKSIKHLHLLPERVDTIGDKLLSGARVFDSEVYSALKNYNAADVTPPQEGAE